MNVPMADVRLSREGSVAMIGLLGEIDLSNVAEVRREIFGFIENSDVSAIVDLSGLAFIDSAGLGMLFELADVLDERRQHLLLVSPPGSQPRRTVDVVGLDSRLGIFDSVHQAIEAAATR